MSRWTAVATLSIAAAAFALGACAELNTAAGQLADAAARPDVVTGKRELNLISRAEETGVGERVEQGILADARAHGFAIDVDEATRARCLAVMQRLVSVSHRPDVPITVHLIEDPDWNASATIGGYVFVNRGLFAAEPGVKNDDELAAILGHEWGHVTAGHIPETISRQQVDRRMQSGVYATGFMFAAGQEDEADKLGVLYASLAGYDPRAATSLWTRSVQCSGPQAPYLMQVHPLTQDRVVSTARYGAVAAKYRVPGKVNPQVLAILQHNDLFAREEQTEGLVALLDAAAKYYTAGQAAKVEQKQRESAARVQGHRPAARQAVSGLPSPRPAAQQAVDGAGRVEQAFQAAIDASVALQLRSITHPSGNGATLGRVTVQSDNSGARVLIPFSWSGGLTGHRYTTIVWWQLGPAGHVGSGIESDTAVVSVSAANVVRVDDYLRQTVLPSFVENLRR